jgi:photosystem II stability/assembly factor-like uncharacterized protein
MVLGVFCLILGLIAACVILRRTDAPTGAVGAAAKFGHVHGVGVNPADGTVYAATHYGLFRLSAQRAPVRVADRIQDFMGFTVVGPDHFLASGHPAEGFLGPKSVGLIESIDGGNTWTSRSLEDQADFHALRFRHDLVYGYNSLTGAFMVSADQKTWETRTKLPMADFAISPDDQNVLVATTEQGLLRSEDGGLSFTPTSAPLLLLISWADDDTLVGVTPEGVLQVSGDKGSTWQQRGALDGSPEALEATNSDDIYAAAGGAVMASTDGGRTFTVIGSG